MINYIKKHFIIMFFALIVFISGITMLFFGEKDYNTADATSTYYSHFYVTGLCKISATSSTAKSGTYKSSLGKEYNYGQMGIYLNHIKTDNPGAYSEQASEVDDEVDASSNSTSGIKVSYWFSTNAWWDSYCYFRSATYARANPGFGVSELRREQSYVNYSSWPWVNSISNASTSNSTTGYDETVNENDYVYGGSIKRHDDYWTYDLAIFNPIKYTIYYNSDNSHYATKYVTFGEKYVLPTKPTKKGYTFGGWFTEKNGKGTEKTSSTVLETDDVSLFSNTELTLYAKWTANTYDIVYDANEGNGSYNTTIKYNQTFTLRDSTGFDKTGYDFIRWSITPDGSNTSWDGWINQPWTYTYDYGLTFYAQWSPRTYYVTYQPNGGLNDKDGKATPVQVSIKYDSDFILKDCNGIFSKEGYYFTSWNEKKDGTGTSWAGWINRAWPYTYDYSINLYAQWAKETYNFRFLDLDGNSIETRSDIPYGATLNDLKQPKMDGYTFKGWRENKSGKVYTDSIKVIDFGDNETNVDLYPVWEANIIDITLNASPGSGGTGHIWYKFNDDENIIYSHSDCTGKIYDISIPTRVGYDFTGYESDGKNGGINDHKYISLNGAIDDSIVGQIYSNSTLYSTWSPKKYKITYDYNLSEYQDKTKTYKQTYDALYTNFAPAKTGKHIFLGWYTSKSGGTEITSSMTYQIDGNQILYAHWEETWALYAQPITKGDGSKEKPYQVETSGNLAWMINNFQNGAYYLQTQDIDMEAHTWLPIGTTDKPFTGQYVGKSYTIFNLNTSKSQNIRDGRDSNVGLFGVMDKGNIETIIMKDADITGKNNVGAVVGYANQKVTVDSVIIIGQVRGQSDVGVVLGNCATQAQAEVKIALVYDSESSIVDKTSLGGNNVVSTNCVAINKLKSVSKTADYDESAWSVVPGMPYPIPKKIAWIGDGE